MRRTAVLLALVSTLAPACKGQDNTKIVVAVWSDLAVPDDLDSVRIEVTGSGSKTFPLTAGSDPSAPLAELELVPLGAKDENFIVTATGLHAGNEVVAQTASVSFVPGQSLLLKLFLYGNCRGLNCSADHTCAAGACDQPIAVPNLPPYDPSVPLSPPDAGVGGNGGTGGSSGMSGSGGASGGVGGTIGSGGVVATGGIVGTGGTTAACQESATKCSDYGLQTCSGGQWGAAVACSTGLVCERCPPAACLDPTWAEWPMPNSQVDVTAGAPNLGSYMDNKDGTVTDNITGLMWQQAVLTTTYTWSQAVAYCPTLNLAGHSDWRLPSRIELVSIVDFGVTSGATIDATYFPSTPASWFWSSSPAGSSYNAWYVYFDDGSTDYFGVSNARNVRCVR
jgi:Protein of unknown function (DUF1566)